jgi:hypothetical protein
MTALRIATLLTLTPAILAAQSEDRLREEFEGRTVSVRLEMPATENGVDVYPLRSQPIDFSRYADRIKEYGAALRPGDRAIVTKVKVKEKHIEFQLGGGGYGTMGDPSGSISAPTAPKSDRERNLERDIRNERDGIRKRRMQDELDRLRTARRREDARLQAATAGASQQERERVRTLALQGGSRFNIRFDERVPEAQLTPEAIRAALARYVDFSGSDEDVSPSPVSEPARREMTLRRGLLDVDVAELLGRPESTAERQEGKLRVVTRTYLRDDERIEAEFVEGVLIRYRVSSR